MSLFRIGDFSRFSRVPVSALRYYADIGLLPPAQVDPETGYRYYSAAQLPRLNRILVLKDLGLALPQIARLLDEAVSPAELRGMLQLKRAEIAQRVEEEQERLGRVEARLRLIEQEGKMPEQEVVIKALEGTKALIYRTTLTSTDQFGPLWGRSYGALRQRGLDESAPCFTLYLDEEWDPAHFNVELVYPVAGEVPESLPFGEGEVLTVRDIPAVPAAACTIYVGSYDGLSAAYMELGRWIEQNGYRVVGPPREVYLRGADSGQEPVTELQFPVVKA